MTVRFSPTSTVHCYFRSQDDTWYSSEDEQRFKQQAKEDRISCLRRNLKTCPVGLELKIISTDICKKRILTRELVRLAVRLEQERPHNDDEYDRQERIAAASMKHSEWTRLQAETIGAFQAMAAVQE